MTVTEHLANVVARTTYGDLPDALVKQVKLFILDTIACGIAGATVGAECGVLGRVVLDSTEGGTSSVLGRAGKHPARNAAFVNGASVHALNFDALGPAGAHLGVAALPAPLAFAEAARATGQDLIVACALAAEVTSRLAMTLAQSEGRSAGVLDGQLLAYFGAVVGAAKAASLPAEAIHSALGLASMQSAGSMEIMREGDAPAKAVYGAFPNGAAALCVELAASGLDGRCDAIGGDWGLLATYAPGAALDTLTDRLGVEYLSADVHFKPWPTSLHAHPYIEAAIAVATSARRSAADITGVILYVEAAERAWVEPIAKRQRPENNASAANSIQFSVAAALVHRKVTIDQLTNAGLSDPRVLEIAAKTVCRFVDGSRDRRGIEVRYQTDSFLRGACVPPLGSAPRPLPPSAITTKAAACLPRMQREAASERLIEAIEALDHRRGLGSLQTALVHAAQ